MLKTFGLADLIKKALDPLKEKINFAFIYGSIAKQQDSAASDIDLLIIGNDLSYVDTFSLLDQAEKFLSRKINPTFYSPHEWKRKLKSENNFITQVIKQPKIFLIGTEDELIEFNQDRAAKTLRSP